MTQNMKDIKWIAGENKVKDFKADFLPTPFDRYKSNKLSYNQKETEKKKTDKRHLWANISIRIISLITSLTPCFLTVICNI